MQLALSFSTLLASILVLLSAADVQAAPAAKRTKAVTLPLTRIHQTRTDVHPQVVSAPFPPRPRTHARALPKRSRAC